MLTRYDPTFEDIVFEEPPPPSKYVGGGGRAVATPTPRPSTSGLSDIQIFQQVMAGWITMEQLIAEKGAGEARSIMSRKATPADTAAIANLKAQKAAQPTATATPTGTPTPVPAAAGASAGSAGFSDIQGNVLPGTGAVDASSAGAMADAATTGAFARAASGSPTGRTFEQITGTQYLSDAERAWYLAEAQRRQGGSQPASGDAGASGGGSSTPAKPRNIRYDTAAGWIQDTGRKDAEGKTMWDQIARPPTPPGFIPDRNRPDKGQVWDPVAEGYRSIQWDESEDRFVATENISMLPGIGRTGIGEALGTGKRVASGSDLTQKGAPLPSQGTELPGPQEGLPAVQTGIGMTPVFPMGQEAAEINPNLDPRLLGEGVGSEVSPQGVPMSTDGQQGLALAGMAGQVSQFMSPAGGHGQYSAAILQAYNQPVPHDTIEAARAAFKLQNEIAKMREAGSTQEEIQRHYRGIDRGTLDEFGFERDNDLVTIRERPGGVSTAVSRRSQPLSGMRVADPSSGEPMYEFEGGGDMLLKEPVVGFGMHSRRPLFMAAEGGNQEWVDFQHGEMEFNPTRRPIRGLHRGFESTRPRRQPYATVGGIGNRRSIQMFQDGGEFDYNEVDPVTGQSFAQGLEQGPGVPREDMGTDPFTGEDYGKTAQNQAEANIFAAGTAGMDPEQAALHEAKQDARAALAEAQADFDLASEEAAAMQAHALANATAARDQSILNDPRYGAAGLPSPPFIGEPYVSRQHVTLPWQLQGEAWGDYPGVNIRYTSPEQEQRAKEKARWQQQAQNAQTVEQQWAVLLSGQQLPGLAVPFGHRGRGWA